MKRLHFFLPLLALVLAVAASAYTARPALDTHYFRFDGGAADDLLDPANYVYLGTSKNTTGCSSGSVNCIIAMGTPPDSQNLPDFETAGITEESQVDALTENWKP